MLQNNTRLLKTSINKLGPDMIKKRSIVWFSRHFYLKTNLRFSISNNCPKDIGNIGTYNP